MVTETINEAKENITGLAKSGPRPHRKWKRKVSSDFLSLSLYSNLNSVVHDGIHKDSNTVLGQDLK